jgi:iron(II)-dependent oxidoreductase
MLALEKDAVLRSSLWERFVEARKRSDATFSLVRPDSIYERPIPERHRIIFYLGHLEAFDWNLLREEFGLKGSQPEFDRLFAFGIDPIGGGLPADQPSDWPSAKEVRGYVANIRAALDQKLNDPKLNDQRFNAGAIDSSIRGGNSSSLTTLLNVAIEHRLMHVETLAYMLHRLPYDRKIAQLDPPLIDPGPLRHASVEIPAGEATLGLSRANGDFGWDNEFEANIVSVPAFGMDRYMVTNQQFLGFIESGGYEARELWSDEDWDWKTAQGISHPVFWQKAKDGWMYRTMFEEIALAPDWPAYVSHAEAAAYARWAGKDLPTEAEWHRAAYGTADGVEQSYPWGTKAPEAYLGNFDFHRWNPTPVNAFSEGKSRFGVEGMLGNGWEWTSTVFAPFAGFAAFPFYRGYSADFFDGKHFVMKGGSPRTAACMLRPSFRNWFQAHYQYVYAGFRCVSR